jgi:hypothetical protein
VVVERSPLAYLALQRNDGGGVHMMKFDFMVQTRDRAVVTVARSMPVPDSIAVWPIIVKLAHKIDQPGSLILVANEAGEVIIRIGIAYARNLAHLQIQNGAVGKSDEIFPLLN